MKRLLGQAIMAGLFLVGALLHAEDVSSGFTYRNDAGDSELEYKVTKDGLSLVRIGGVDIAKGKIEAQDFSGCMNFKNNYDWRKAPKDKLWEYKDRYLEIVGAKHARVLHKSAEIEAMFDYLFSGEDVEIQCSIKNITDNTTFEAVDISGLVFRFSKEPTGLFTDSSIGYPGQIIPTCRAPNFHPSFGANFGGSELSDGNVGVGATPLRTGWSKTLISWEGYKSEKKSFHYVRAAQITPGSTFRCDFLLRISRNLDWKHLLEPYKKHFNSTFGGVRYKNSNRPIGFIQGTSDKWIKDGNPYGYGGKYRFDTDEGTKIFLEENIPVLKKADAQGMIIWSFTPWNPRGCNFRPDTDALPPEVWKQVPVIAEAFKKEGLGFGICMRPQIVTTLDWEHDTALTIHPDDLSQLGLAIRPFNRLIKEGMNTFYLDTFGSAWNDARTMMFLREMWGDEKIFTATEFWSDVSLLYSPGYSHFLWDKEKKAYYEFWHREHLWEVCQWMSPGVQIASPGGVWDTKDERPEGTPDPFRYLYERHVIPIFFTVTRTSAEMADQLNALTKEFLDGNGEFVK